MTIKQKFTEYLNQWNKSHNSNITYPQAVDMLTDKTDFTMNYDPEGFFLEIADSEVCEIQQQVEKTFSPLPDNATAREREYRGYEVSSATVQKIMELLQE